MAGLLVSLSLASFLCLLHQSTAQNGACYTQVSMSQTAYRSVGRSDSYRCGFLGWGRCRRTLYSAQSFSTTTYASQFGCCTGYSQSGMTCTPICNNPACANGGTCTAPNTCSCAAGWTGSDCQTDIDECTSGTDNCDHTCTNTAGSFTCSCNSGYTLSTNGHTCIDNNECTDGTAQCEVTCRNTPGSFVCECNPGYELATNGYSCQDIDECTTGTHQCAQNCQNTVGSYICSCNDGYTLGDNGRDCNDNNECASSSTNNCQQVCVNIPGSFRCDCDPGYGLNSDGSTCSDIDECATGTSLCAQNCSNTVGSYTCSCGTGYNLNTNGYDCDDINECNGIHPCVQVCNNTLGSFVCSCNLGYRLNSDGISCSDINECTEETDNCDQNCANTVGSYTCSCNSGYVLDVDGFTCDDIDECMIGTHICQQVCNNTQGSHECACFPGFTINTDGFTCRDLDECAIGVDECDQNCANVVGSYTCSCGIGWTLNPDGFRCDDIDECEAGAVGNITCRERCVNDPGTYHCDCFPGYIITADMVSCTDLNECNAGIDACEQLCINNVGSYTCVCNQGYTRTYDAISCLGPPANAFLSPTGSRNITLIWDPPVDNEGRDGNITLYSIACNSQQHPGFTITASANEEATEFVLMRLLPYSMYNCCLSVETTNGISPSVCIQGTSLEEAPEGPPTAINITNVSSYDLTVTWEPPLVPNGMILMYTFYVTSENGEVVAYQVDGSLTSYVITNLRPYSLVGVNMSASTSAGEGPQSERIEMRTAQAAPSLVIGTTADVISNSTIVIEWDPPLFPNGILIYYNIEVNHELSGYNYSTRLLPSEPRVVNVAGLYPFLPYMVTVTAATVAGESDPATILVYTQHGVPIVPTISSVLRLTGQRAIVVWVPLTPDETRGLLTTLQIAYEPLREGELCQPIVAEGGSNVLHMTEDLMVQSMATIPGLLPNVQYCVAIQVGTSAGESGFSETLMLPLPPRVPFQIRLQLPADLGCLNFTDIEADQKLLDMKNLVSGQVASVCDCHYTSNFIIEDSFLCGGNPKESIFEGYLLTADDITTTELLDIIQRWILQKPELTLAGEQFTADPYCQISVEQLGVPQCNATNPTESATNPPGARAPLAKEIIILASICGGALLVIVAAVIVGIVCCCHCTQKRKVFSKRTVTDHDDCIAIDQPSLVDANIVDTLGRTQKRYPINQYQPSYDPNDIADDDRVPLTEADVHNDYSLRGFENPVFETGPGGEAMVSGVPENENELLKAMAAADNDSCSDTIYDDVY